MLYGMYAIARAEELLAEAQKGELVAQLRVSGDGQPSARRVRGLRGFEYRQALRRSRLSRFVHHLRGVMGARRAFSETITICLTSLA